MYFLASKIHQSIDDAWWTPCATTLALMAAHRETLGETARQSYKTRDLIARKNAINGFL